MATSFFKIYDAFLARIAPDDWTLEEELAIVERDWQQFLDIAVFRFKYPRVELKKIILPEEERPQNVPSDIELYGFSEDLTNDEIQILALMMKHEWVKRCITSWDNIRYLYADKDFSQANHLDKLIKLEASVADDVHRAEGIYDRSRGKKPSNKFKRLAGKNFG